MWLNIPSEMMSQLKRFIKYTTIFYAIVALVYWVWVRPMHLKWGATTAEINMKLPGDELISTDRVVTTRAINIEATKEKVWPWIAQTGQVDLACTRNKNRLEPRPLS